MKKHKNKMLTFAALFAIATIIIHLINHFISISATLKEKLHIGDKNYYKWRFGKVYYTKQGEGTPLLLIHDMIPGSSGYEWNRVEDELAKTHTVYTIDLLGCGRSEKPSITYTNFVYVQLLCDFIKNVIGCKTDVIASGLSGSFVIMACQNSKDSFNRIMLVNPKSLSSLNQMPENKDKMLKFFLEIPVFGTLVYYIAVSKTIMKNMFIEKIYYNPFHVDQDIIEAYYEGAHLGGVYAKNTYASQSCKYMNINIYHALKSIDNSVYIVEGEIEPNKDNVIAEYQDANPSIEVSVVKKAKHIPQIENPKDFLEQTEIFF